MHRSSLLFYHLLASYHRIYPCSIHAAPSISTPSITQLLLVLLYLLDLLHYLHHH